MSIAIEHYTYPSGMTAFSVLDLAMVQHRAGNPSPLMPVEEALLHRWSTAERQAEAKVDRRADVVAGRERAYERIAALVEETQADEVIASSNTFDPGERLASYERLAIAVGLARRTRPDPWHAAWL